MHFHRGLILQAATAPPFYYDWRTRPASARSLRHVWLTEQIRGVHWASFGTYGSRRVHAELRLGLGITVGHGAVELPMCRAGLVGLPGRKRGRHVHDAAFDADLVDRNFPRYRPDELWVTDISEHPTREGKVYCAVVLDVHSRQVVGWSIDAVLATDALSMAIANRQPTTRHRQRDPLRPRRAIHPLGVHPSGLKTPACHRGERPAVAGQVQDNASGRGPSWGGVSVACPLLGATGPRPGAPALRVHVEPEIDVLLQGGSRPRSACLSKPSSARAALSRSRGRSRARSRATGFAGRARARAALQSPPRRRRLIP